MSLLLITMPEQSQTIRRSQRVRSSVVKFSPVSAPRTSCRMRETAVRLSPCSFANKSYY